MMAFFSGMITVCSKAADHKFFFIFANKILIELIHNVNYCFVLPCRVNGHKFVVEAKV